MQMIINLLVLQYTDVDIIEDFEAIQLWAINNKLILEIA